MSGVLAPPDEGGIPDAFEDRRTNVAGDSSPVVRKSGPREAAVCHPSAANGSLGPGLIVGWPWDCKISISDSTAATARR